MQHMKPLYPVPAVVQIHVAFAAHNIEECTGRQTVRLQLLPRCYDHVADIYYSDKHVIPQQNMIIDIHSGLSCLQSQLHASIIDDNGSH
ncbi:hypothetical protein D3C76_1729420 [compost metagenome]